MCRTSTNAGLRRWLWHSMVNTRAELIAQLIAKGKPRAQTCTRVRTRPPTGNGGISIRHIVRARCCALCVGRLRISAY